MVALLPPEVLQTVFKQFPYRSSQIRDLAILYNDIFSRPSLLIAYGLVQTQKTEVISAVLEARAVRYALIQCQECLSQRHLLSKIFSACLTALAVEEDAEQYDRIDTVNALAVALEKLFRQPAKKLVLVLDEIDEQRGATATLLPALARLGDLVSSLSLIFTTSSPQPLPLSKSGVPHIHFPPYIRPEAISLVAQLPIPLPSFEHESNIDDLERTYQSFIVTLYDALIGPTSISNSTFQELCQKLWPRFVWPALSGETPRGAKMWNFSRLYLLNKSLFQTEGEDILIDTLRTRNHARTFEELREHSRKQTEPDPTLRPSTPSTSSRKLYNPSSTHGTPAPAAGPPLLKHFTTLLLLSSYLASHTISKHDIVLFSRLSSASLTKGGRVRKTPSKKSPFRSLSKSSATNTSANQASMGAGEFKMATRTKNVFDLRFGAPKPFTLERLLAILRAIHPEGISNHKGAADRVYKEIAELERLRLVVMLDDEEIEGSGKWRVNVSREWVAQIASRHGLNIAEWELDDV